LKEDRFLGTKAHIHWAWIILATCFVNLFINYSVRLGYGVVLPEMIRDLGLSRTAGGSIFNAYLFSYIVLTPLTGFLTDRLGARRVIATCSLILGLGVILMGTVRGLFLACLFYAVAGIGATGMWTPVITVVQRWFAPNRRGLALGILSTGYGLGFATMGVAFPWIVSNFNWRYSWFFLGAGALAMVVANGLLLRSDPESAGYLPWGQKGPAFFTGPEEKRYSEEVSFLRVFRGKTFWLIGLSYFCIGRVPDGVAAFQGKFFGHSARDMSDRWCINHPATVRLPWPEKDPHHIQFLYCRLFAGDSFKWKFLGYALRTCGDHGRLLWGDISHVWCLCR
jgi:sugar phosphate permease